MSKDVNIGSFTINCGYYNVFRDVLSIDPDGYTDKEEHGLAALNGLMGWEAISVLEDGFNKLNEYGREPMAGESEVILRMSLILCACVRRPYDRMNVY